MVPNPKEEKTKEEKIESSLLGESEVKREKNWSFLKREIPAFLKDKTLLRNVVTANKTGIILFAATTFVVLILPKAKCLAALNENVIPLLGQEVLKKPKGSFLSYLRTYGSTKAWIEFLKKGTTEDFYYYTAPLVKVAQTVQPIIMFGGGFYISRLVFDQVLNFENSLCRLTVTSLENDVKMLELLLKVKQRSEG